MNIFRLPIGDWSDDGHGQTQDYLIKSNKTVQEIRELYFQACDKLGFSLDGSYKKSDLSPMADYEDYIFKEETLNALLDFGVKIDEELVNNLREIYKTDPDEWDNIVNTEELCKIVLEFIKTQDSELILEIIPEPEAPMFQFYGYDDKKRHIGYFGYGLFD